jgi:hypothetical protein
MGLKIHYNFDEKCIQQMDRIIILDENNLRELKSEIAEAVIIALKSMNGPLNTYQAPSEWVDGDEAKRILGYQKTKMQELRTTGAIVFTKYGRKIKYLRQSLLDFLDKNKRN